MDTPSERDVPAPERSAAGGAPEPTTAADSAPPKPPKPYRLLGVLDPERQNMVAFALKMPSDWRAQQSFQRRWDGAVAQPQIFISLAAPDGRSRIDYLPALQYIFTDGPMANNLRAQKRSFGMPEQSAPNELAPMMPVPYIQHILLRDLAQRGIVLGNVSGEQTSPQSQDQNGLLNVRGSVDGTLPNGNRVRVECRITHSARQMRSDMFHSWIVIPSITQTSSGDLEAVHAHTRVAQDSFVTNPAWQRLEQELQARGFQANSEASRRMHESTMDGMRANTAAMTRAHEQRMGDIRNFGEANTARFNERMRNMDGDMARFNERMAGSDREQRIRVDTIRGESQYTDPSTGQRVKVEDGYNHVYRSQQNPDLYYGTNTPIDSGKLDWQELQKVQLRDY